MTPTPLTLDYTNMLAPALGGRGVDPDLLDGTLADRFHDARAVVEERREAGEMGFFELPYATETAARVREVADSFGQWFEDLVVLGIGGSALGTRTLRDALLGPHWNQLSGEEREYYARLHVLDNVDPATVGPFLDRLDPGRTLFNVVSKSGSTAETMSQYLVVRERLEQALGTEKARGHFLFTTDPERGVLREIAREEEIPALPVPPAVGGRFSALSPVGLLPAAVAGIDIDALLAGAAEMEERCRREVLAENPAGLLAVLLHHADTALGMPIHVLMPYSDRLHTFALWFQQLWAESLGKVRPGRGDAEDAGRGDAGGGEGPGRSGGGTHVGPTPLPALGATDQHAQVQLFMEGPRDKVVLFLAVADRGPDVEIPTLLPDRPALSYLGGHSLGELLDTERRATTEALRRRGRPSVTLEVDRISPESLGALFMLFQVATVYAGALYGIDPLDQPGVELGKELTYGLLGRDGYVAPEPPVGDRRRV